MKFSTKFDTNYETWPLGWLMTSPLRLMVCSISFRMTGFRQYTRQNILITHRDFFFNIMRISFKKIPQITIEINQTN